MSVKEEGLAEAGSPLLDGVGLLRESAMMTENQSSILLPIASRAFCVHSAGDTHLLYICHTRHTRNLFILT